MGDDTHEPADRENATGRSHRGDAGDDRRLPITRRSMLVGLTSAGALGSLTGAGTNAFAIDAESFEDNSIGSDDVGLLIGWRSTYNGTVRSSQGSCEEGDLADLTDNREPVVDLNAIKPGDAGSIEACLQRTGNAAHVWVQLADYAFEENQYRDAEADAGDDTPDEGELQDHLRVTDARYVADCGSDAPSEERPLDPGSGTLSEVIEGALGAGIRMGTPATETFCVRIEWELPEDVPETILTDSVEFGLEFAAEQARHNDDPTNPMEDTR